MAQGRVGKVLEAVNGHRGGAAGCQGPLAVRGGLGSREKHVGEGHFPGTRRNLRQHLGHLPFQRLLMGMLLSPLSSVAVRGSQ